MNPAVVTSGPSPSGEVTRLDTALLCNSCSGFGDDELQELVAIATLYSDAQ